MDRRTFLSGSAAVASLFGLAGPAIANLRVALRAAEARGEPLLLPAGTWQLDGPLRVHAAGLRGAGAELTRLVAAPGAAGPLLIGASGPFAVAGLTVEGAVRTRIGQRGSHFVRIA